MADHMEELKWFASLGVGGVLALYIFITYRKDALRWQEQEKGRTEILIDVIRDNTVAITALTEIIKSKDNRRNG